MANTTYSSLRYPVASSAPNVSQDLQNLATDLDQKVIVSVATASARTALTSGQKYTNMMVRETSTGRLFEWNGSTWDYIPRGARAFATLANRDAYFTGAMAPIAGDQCVCLGVLMTHDGTAWRFTLSGRSTAVTDANGFIAFPHGGGQAPVAWVITPAYQSSSAIDQFIQVLSSNNAGDVTVLGAHITHTDTTAYFGAGTTVAVNWTAQF